MRDPIPLRRAMHIPFARFFTFLALSSAIPGMAQEAPPDSVPELPEATVQASRVARTPDKLPQRIEMITNRDIAMTVADDLVDQLKKSSSIDVVQYPGLLSGVGIRGFRPQFSGLNQRTLLLLDGRPAGAANYATMDLIPFDRIEILKGPFSALYGPQAMGGVINVVPRRSRGRIVNEAKGGTGSFGRLQGSFLSGGGLSERLNYDLALHALNQSRDYRIGRGHSLKDLGFVDDHRPVLLPNGAPEEKVEELGDGKVRPSTRYEQQAAALRLGWDVDGNWSVESHINLSWKTHSLTVGAEYQTKGTQSLSWKSATARNLPTRPDYGISNASLFAQTYLGFHKDRLIGTLGARYDRIAFEVLKTKLLDSYHAGSNDYDVFSPSAGLLYRFDTGIRLLGTVGRGFVTPDAYQVAGYSESFKGTGRVAITTGNADLKPERNLTFDGGIGFQKPALGLALDLTYFHTEVADRLAARTVSRPALPLEMVDGERPIR